MIQGIGIDIIELERVKSVYERAPKFADRILTPIEQERFHGFQKQSRKIEFLAGRFAAKEAIAKAYGYGIGKVIGFQDVEIMNNQRGAPSIVVKGKRDPHTFVSISHSKDYAVAQVIVEAE